ncbi:hypothetical protein ACQQ2T_04900 [Paraclostridium tenue]
MRLRLGKGTAQRNAIYNKIYYILDKSYGTERTSENLEGYVAVLDEVRIEKLK